MEQILKKIIVDFPELDQQNKILEQNKTIQNQIKIIIQKANTITELKKHILDNFNFFDASILDITFSGKLV